MDRGVGLRDPSANLVSHPDLRCEVSDDTAALAVHPCDRGVRLSARRGRSGPCGESGLGCNPIPVHRKLVVSIPFQISVGAKEGRDQAVRRVYIQKRGLQVGLYVCGGSAGSIRVELLRVLCRQVRCGYEVGGFYLHSASVKHLDRYDIKLYAGDIVNKEVLWYALGDFAPDFIVHLAGITFVPHANSDPINAWRVNVIGTLNVLEWLRNEKTDVKTIIVSSGEVYGAPKSSDDLPFTENSCLNPQNIYASTKASLDFAARQYMSLWKLPIIVVRPFNHIGPGQSENFVASAFASQIAEIASGKREPIVRTGNLSASRDFLDVRDVVRAYRLLLEKVESGVFNICSGKAIEAAKRDYRSVTKKREIANTLPTAFARLVKEPDETLVEILADKVEDLCGYRPDPEVVSSFLVEQMPIRYSAKSSTPHRVRTQPIESETPGPYGFQLFGKEYITSNATQVLVGVFEALSNRDPTFLERFAALPRHGKKRRYLAKERQDLYPGRIDLAERHSYQLNSGWWIGTNYSNATKKRIIEIACKVAGIEYGTDLELELG